MVGLEKINNYVKPVWKNNANIIKKTKDIFDMEQLVKKKNENMDKHNIEFGNVDNIDVLKNQLLEFVKAKGFEFADSIYCDASNDKYHVLNASSTFFLEKKGKYSKAVAQIVGELSDDRTKGEMLEKLQLSYIREKISSNCRQMQLPYRKIKDGRILKGRITVLFCDESKENGLQHFILGVDVFYERSPVMADEKLQLSKYYEQLKKSVLENGNYVEALVDTAEALYTVNLTNDRLEKIFYRSIKMNFNLEMDLPCSYNEYCIDRSKNVTDETLENYRIAASTEKLIKRFESGDKQVTIEYQERGNVGQLVWLQKTVLMSKETIFDYEENIEKDIIRGIVLFKNTSEFHVREEQERERLQIAYENADSESKAKTEFMNRMSHDIRTPLNGIMGMIELLRKEWGNLDRMNDCVNKIALSTSHLAELVNDILDMSKIDSDTMQLQMESFDLKQLINQVNAIVEAQISEMKLKYVQNIGDLQHSFIVGDQLQLRRILLNLLSNAIKYNKVGGNIEFSINEVSSNDKEATFKFIVSDTGVGMSKEFVENELFKPFTQEKADARTRYKGTGLGMSIVKKLIEKMGGTIEVESIPDKGTKYTVEITFETEKENETEKREQVDDNALDGINIILAEDNDINMEIAQFYLEDYGANVDIAWNGKEALELFEQSDEGKYGIILMDVMMPVIDGLEATQMIRKSNRVDAKKIPIIAMTAQASKESEDECINAGMTGYVSKPIKPKKLIKYLLKQIKKNN